MTRAKTSNLARQLLEEASALPGAGNTELNLGTLMEIYKGFRTDPDYSKAANRLIWLKKMHSKAYKETYFNAALVDWLEAKMLSLGWDGDTAHV